MPRYARFPGNRWVVTRGVSNAIVRRLPRKRQTMFVSATLDGEVAELARAYTHNPSRFDAKLPGQLEP